jgi:hypothetical protein
MFCMERKTSRSAFTLITKNRESYGFSRNFQHLSSYLLKKKMQGRRTLVLMLEPHRCNLHCAGCGRIREYKDVLDKTLTLEECQVQWRSPELRIT